MDDLTILNAKLPAGIKAVIVNNTVRYHVRTSVKGKKYGLGTFTDYNAAVSALVQFKIKKSFTVDSGAVATAVEDVIASNQIAAATAAKVAVASTPDVELAAILQEQVDQIGPQLITDPDAPLRITVEGKDILIPAAIVRQVFDRQFMMTDDEEQQASDF